MEYEHLNLVDPAKIAQSRREMPAHSIPTPPPSRGKVATSPPPPEDVPKLDMIEDESEVKAPLAKREFRASAVTSAVEEQPPSNGKLNFRDPDFGKDGPKDKGDVGVEHIESAGPVREEVKGPTEE